MKNQLIRTFGRIHGKKLSARQQWLVENLLPKLNPNPGGATFVESRLSKAYSSAILEIGFGAGEHLLQLARENPDSLVIGAEPFINGVASLLSKMTSGVGADIIRPIDREAVKDSFAASRKIGRITSAPTPQSLVKPEYRNIRIWPDDVRKLLSLCPSAHLSLQNPNLILNQIWILHPDPWPKSRHEKRRLCSADFLTLLARHLSPNGKIIIGTDHYGYYDWVSEQVKKTELKSEIINQQSEIIETRYQKKNKAGTKEPKYLVLTPFPRALRKTPSHQKS